MQAFANKIHRALSIGLLFILGAAIAAPVVAQDTGIHNPGFKTCVQCHDEDSEHPVLSMLQTPHGMVADGRTPMANDGCVSCHGASSAHVESEGRKEPDIDFHEKDASVGNAQCQTCHLGKHLTLWEGSRHQIENVSCASCHAPHLAQDPVLDKTMQPDVCLTCHKEQRASLVKPFRHPIREGEMTCTGCHAPHGSTSDGLLAKNTINETCNTCHADKRGPFLWEHQPASEDCTICHAPHGSVHTAMLKQRGPWLCQNCHLANQHPSTAYSGTGLPGATRPSGAQQLLGKNCLNCHVEVHGTNHPSGARFTR
jgi:DmsE family decaheme c-type cytochrome